MGVVSGARGASRLAGDQRHELAGGHAQSAEPGVAETVLLQADAEGAADHAEGGDAGEGDEEGKLEEEVVGGVGTELAEEQGTQVLYIRSLPGRDYRVSCSPEIWESVWRPYFDLDRDPHELHDAIQDPGCQARINLLRSQLVQLLAGREEGYSDGQRLIPGQKQTPCLKHLFRESTR